MAIIKPEQLGSGLYSISGSFSGSFQGDHLGTASYAVNALSASYALSSSYASTASFAPLYLPLTGGTIDGNVTINGTASIAFLNVTYESASVIYSSGSNQFGDATDDIQTLIGTVIVSGSQQITGSLNVTDGITGSLFGTSSYALTSSYSPITIGTTQITSGVAGRVLFEGAGNVVQEDSGLFWDNTNRRLGIGTSTPASTLNIGGSGTLASGLTFGSGVSGIWLLNNTTIGIKINNVDKFWFRATDFYPDSSLSLDLGLSSRRWKGLYTQQITDNGSNVLINTITDQGGKLQVKAGGALSTDIALRVRNSADTADLTIINGLGNVGIGTTTPDYPLHINRDTTSNYIQLSGNSNKGLFAAGAGLLAFDTSGNFRIYTGGVNERIIVDSTGNVGIGTTSPSQKLEVNGNALIKTSFVGTITAFGDDYSSFSHISRANTNDYSLLSDNVGTTYLNASSSQAIKFRIDNTDKVILDNNGNFGIGTTTPNTRLDVNGDTTITGSLIVTGGITGSLQGTASFAETASNILGGKATHVPYFITDTTLATSSIFQSGSTSVIINQDNNTTANPEALYVWQSHPTSINVVSGKGNLDNYLQLNIQNTNQGTAASSDIVATADNGNEITNYIDMGINSENFTGPIGSANDAYLYSTGQHLHIGNATPGQYVGFFAGGDDVDTNMKLILDPFNIHQMTGSLRISGSLNVSQGITGSLFGTSSYSARALSASYADNAGNSANAVSASYALNSSTSDTSTSASHAIIADSALSANYAANAGNGGVTNLIAGSGVTLLPPTGVGAVTIITTGGGGVTIISGSNITQSFVNSDTWTFNHGLGIRTPTITVFDSNYNQIIPENIVLTDTASATITFPTLESGFAVGMVGGVAGNAYSASYSLFSTYANTASFYNETDPVFVAKSGSLATTGSNSFKGNQTITGSLIVSSSNSLTVIGPITITGSLLVSGSTTQIGSNTLTGNTILSGSISVSGSQTFKGNLDLTGSLTVSGSTIKTGNNTLIGNNTITGSNNISGSNIIVGNNTVTGINTIIGNTILSGSITISGSTTNTIIGNTNVYGEFNVSGSSIFSNSFFTVTGSTFVKGVTSISGSTDITGSLNVVDGDINIVSGSSFRRWGNKLFNYGAFSDTTTQTGSADTAHAIRFDTTDVALGISLSGSSAIKIENKGIYNFQWSGQLHQGANASIVSVWLRINGTDVPGSRGDVTLASNDDALPAWNYVLPFNSNDAIELYWSSNRSTTSWVFSPTGSLPPRPSTASIIATITQIA